jgi:hypothetical protein
MGAAIPELYFSNPLPSSFGMHSAGNHSMTVAPGIEVGGAIGALEHGESLSGGIVGSASATGGSAAVSTGKETFADWLSAAGGSGVGSPEKDIETKSPAEARTSKAVECANATVTGKTASILNKEATESGTAVGMGPGNAALSVVVRGTSGSPQSVSRARVVDGTPAETAPVRWSATMSNSAATKEEVSKARQRIGARDPRAAENALSAGATAGEVESAGSAAEANLSMRAASNTKCGLKDAGKKAGRGKRASAAQNGWSVPAVDGAIAASHALAPVDMKAAHLDGTAPSVSAAQNRAASEDVETATRGRGADSPLPPGSTAIAAAELLSMGQHAGRHAADQGATTVSGVAREKNDAAGASTMAGGSNLEAPGAQAPNALSAASTSRTESWERMQAVGGDVEAAGSHAPAAMAHAAQAEALQHAGAIRTVPARAPVGIVDPAKTNTGSGAIPGAPEPAKSLREGAPGEATAQTIGSHAMAAHGAGSEASSVSFAVANLAGDAAGAHESVGATAVREPAGHVAAPQDTFAALDSGLTAPGWVHAGARRAEAGFQDPALGWVSVRADLNAGDVHASVVPGSAEAAQSLSGHMTGLGAYLAAEHAPVATLTMAEPATGTVDSGAGQNMHQGASQHADRNAAGSEAGANSGASVDETAMESAIVPVLEWASMARRDAGRGLHISLIA